MADRPQPASGSRSLWAGAAGLAEFQRSHPCTPRAAGSFRVQRRRADCGGVTVAEWQCSELSADVAPRPEVVLLHVQGGEVRVADRHGRCAAGAGGLLVLGANEPRRVALLGGTHLRALHLPAALVPPRMLSGPGTASGVAEPSEVQAAFLVSLGAVGAAALGRGAPSDFMGQGLRALALAVLEERCRGADGTAEELRRRIERFIDTRLGDGDLTPGSIARAFDVSLRWVHQAFNRDGETLAKYIRERRADAVADEVVGGAWVAGTAALASAYGFSGRDHLGRVFRSRYGCTVQEFQVLARAGRTPQPVAG